MKKLSIIYGKELLTTALPAFKNLLIVTTPPLLSYVKKIFQTRQVNILLAPAMEESLLKQWEAGLPAAGAVLGIGGGVCMDAAKYIGWARQIELWLAPSVISVDACVTPTIAIRRKGKVSYIGQSCPRAILVNYQLIQSAPIHINRAGAGDILSIHTALWDWKKAAEKKSEKFNPQIAEKSKQLLSRLEKAAEHIFLVTETGIKTLLELYVCEVELCQSWGNSRPEEGSEHFWAYQVEYLTKKNFIHGELVALGVLLMSILQDNEVEKICSLIKKLGIRCQPDILGLSKQAIIDSLLTAKSYVEAEKLPFSVINFKTISPAIAEKILQRMKISN